MDVELRPPDDAAGVTLGSTREEASRACAALGDPADFRRGDDPSVSLVVHRPSGLAVFVYFDDDDLVEAVELGRPEGDDDVVSYESIDVFGTPADELVERLGAHARAEVTEGGHSVTFPDLHLALWRGVVPEGPDDEEGRFFEAVLAARPGYDA